MKQSVIFAILTLVIGLSLGYYLAPKVSEPLEPLAASMPATTSAAVLPTVPEAAKSPAQLATTPTAPVAETSSAVDEKALPAFFASGEPFAPANSYTELLQQLSYDGQQQLQQLNNSLLGMFEFNDSRDYRRLLEQGMPTPAELEVLFNVPFQQQLEQLSVSDSWLEEEQNPSRRQAALIANLAYDELERQYRIENPDYQGGRMSDFGSEDWPPALLELYNIATTAHIFSASSSLATARLAEFKRARLVGQRSHPAEDDWLKANQIGALALIGTLLMSDTVYETYAAQQGWTEAELIIYSGIRSALSY